MSLLLCRTALCFLILYFVGVRITRGHAYNEIGHNDDEGVRKYLNPRKRQVTCDPNYKYRSFDGTCNNLNNVEWGKTDTPFRRLLDPVYNNNDGQTPRLDQSDGTPLPNARAVSVVIHDPLDRFVDRANQLVMTWGQFLDHDITSTSTTSSSSVCCSDALVDSGEQHSDVTTGGPCFPITVPTGDRYFTTNRCMEFYRSTGVDVNGVRQQFNKITAWIDGSQVYGHTNDLADSLRSKSDGKLLTKSVNGQDFLPEDTTAICFKEEGTDYCFKAGDDRVSVHPGLTAMHTIFVRYHNKVCDRLKAIHTDWDDETLYQEARRIVIAVLQKITQDEYLRILFGNEDLNTYGLRTGDASYAYDQSIDPTVTNVFATASYRFGHSMVSDSLTIGGQTVMTGDIYLRPKFVLSSLKDVVDATLSETLMTVDRWYTTGLTDQLFEKPGTTQTGTDLAARNIQRGRDHGLPGYNAWRTYCKLDPVTEFSSLLSGSSNRFQRLFSNVDDIDVYSAGLTERPSQGGSLGPVFACLNGQQFKSLKFGDRFWYENQADSTTAFTSDQINQINRIRLSKVICDTVPEITEIQRQVFSKVSDRNPAESCSSFRDIDIERFW